jgi:hypothetical protein
MRKSFTTCPSLPMKSAMRLPRHTFKRRDWLGDACLMAAGGVIGLVALLLPWANDYSNEDVNFSLHRAADISGVMQTSWGPPVLVAALVSIAAAALMIVLGPRLLTVLLSLLAIAAGVVYVTQAIGAADAMVKLYRPGVGLYVVLLVGVLMLPVGIASAMVGLLTRSRPSP